MPNTGFEPAILQSLARRSNQLSYAAVVGFSQIRTRELRVAFEQTETHPTPTPWMCLAVFSMLQSLSSERCIY